MAKYLIKGTFELEIEVDDIEDAHEEAMEIQNRYSMQEFDYQIEGVPYTARELERKAKEEIKASEGIHEAFCPACNRTVDNTRSNPDWVPGRNTDWIHEADPNSGDRGLFHVLQWGIPVLVISPESWAQKLAGGHYQSTVL